mmetsp:Transcript_9394/g.8894  ORF Transcript_9394/g.8894 Transcript_9394/m.8894 type:complete len:90 (+) Transcript_9394:805-1074(+)
MECSWCEEGYYYDYGYCTKDETWCYDGEYYDYDTGDCQPCGNHCSYCYQDWYYYPTPDDDGNSTHREHLPMPPIDEEEATNDTRDGGST